MIRRASFVFFSLLLFGFAPALPAQSPDLHSSTISSASAAEGCLAAISNSAGGGEDAGTNSATNPVTNSVATPGDGSGHGYNLANLDRSASPCTDFYEFAVGGWLKSNPIPPEYPAWGVSEKLEQSNQDTLRQILEDAAKDNSAKPGSNLQKIGDFYASCMDVPQIEAAGTSPLDSEFKRIEEIKDISSLQTEVANLQREGVNAIFRFNSGQDFKDSTKEIAEAGQGGLGLPDREYYFQNDDHSKKLRADYVQHVTNMLQLLGDDPARAATEADVVLRIETSLANASMARVDMRYPEKVYHMTGIAQLRTLTPHFNWEDYFKQTGAPAIAQINVEQPEFFKSVDSDIVAISIADWRIYLRWQLVHAAAPALPAKFERENFNFYGRTLTGAKEMHPRWRRCVEATDSELGEALGEYYVQRAFPPEAKAKALEMVHNLIAALRDDIATLDWMTPATRQKAIEKLDTLHLKIGYPDKWRDYSSFSVDRGAYAGNTLRGDQFEFARDLAKIGKPVDRTEWQMSPPTVNAYYDSSMNEIVFPAGILQPPFFDPKADDALNYGDMGGVIGHEMTHGFDDEGAKFDAQGNLNNWWTPKDLINFQARGGCIAKQFDAFEVEPGLHENGKLEEGESIADLGGLVIAYAAYQKTLAGKPEPPVIDGFTGDQRFFLGYAEGWADTFSPELLRLLAKTDEHPIDRFRTLGPLSNMPSFAKAFGCSTKSPMVRPESKRCRIW